MTSAELRTITALVLESAEELSPEEWREFWWWLEIHAYEKKKLNPGRTLREAGAVEQRCKHRVLMAYRCGECEAEKREAGCLEATNG